MAIPVMIGTKFDDFVQLPLDLQWTIPNQTYARYCLWLLAEIAVIAADIPEGKTHQHLLSVKKMSELSEGYNMIGLSQEHLAPAGYIKIPTDIADYTKRCKFLPVVNNEVHSNSTFKKRFASLENLVLIMFEQDKDLVPKQMSWFGYYSDGSWSTVLSAQETKLYTEDWIGLKILDEA